MKSKQLLSLVIILFIVTGQSFSQNMTPTAVAFIPMRDGKFLAADIYIPSGCTQCPTILIQTPYSRVWYRDSTNYFGGLPLVGSDFTKGNYAFVAVDWRGSFGSFAAAIPSPNRGQDGYDCVEWIAQRPWSNGKVGTWGPSALGRVQYLTAKENPPHLTCMVPLVAGPQYNYLEYFPGGVYRTEYVEQLDALGFGMSNTLLSNPIHNAFWQYIESQNYYPTSINVPALMIGGWYDHNIEVMHTFFNALRSNSPLAVRDKHRLLMGPWAHGGNGLAYVGSANQGTLTYNNAAGWNDSLARMFFDYHLRNVVNGWDQTPYIQYYQMGVNKWKTSSIWPPTGLTDYNFYFHSDSTMDVTPVINSTGSLIFNYNPLDPSPTIGGSTLNLNLGMQGPYDQAPLVESRNDIIGFTTPVLTQDVAMTGKAMVHLKVSSDKKDTDFAVRLTDVYPDGRSMLVMDGIRRMRFRNGYTAADTALMSPGQVYSCVIELPATAITFIAGHRIRVDISSSNYPRFNRNANSGGSMYPGLNGDSLKNPVTALNKIYVDGVTHNSYISLPLTAAPLVRIARDYDSKPAIDVYPNPSNGKFIVKYSSDNNYDLEVCNMLGEKIYCTPRPHAANWAVDLSMQPKGIYLLQLKNEDRVVAVKKVVLYE